MEQRFEHSWSKYEDVDDYVISECIRRHELDGWELVSSTSVMLPVPTYAGREYHVITCLFYKRRYVKD